jgi:hypothetical protein
MGINRAWENIRENIKTSAKDRVGQYEWKQHKPRFDKECSISVDQRKWLNFGGYRIHIKLMKIV